MADAPSVQLKDYVKDVVRMRDKEDKPWHEIAGATGLAAGKAMLAYEMHHLPASEKVTFKNDKELATKVVSLRDKQKLSWGSIVARTDVPESRLRSLYEGIQGEGSTKGNRIGKGGRFPGENGAAPSGNGRRKANKAAKATGTKRAAKKTAPAKKAPAKKVAAKKAAPVKKAAKKASGTRKGTGGAAPSSPPTDHPLVDLDFSDLAARLEGRTIVVGPVREGGKDRTFKVKAVKSLEGNEVNFSDQTSGASHTVYVNAIRRISG